MQIALVSEIITCAFPVAQAVLVFGMQHSLWLSPMPGSRCGSNLLPVSGLEAPRCWAQFCHLPAPVHGVPPQNGAGSWEMHCSRNKRESPHVKHFGWWANECCTEKAFGFILAMFEVWLLSTSQPPDWRFPKLYFDWKEGWNGAGEGGICRHGLGPINFRYLLVLYLLSVEMWPSWCVMLPLHVSQEKNYFSWSATKLRSILLSSLLTNCIPFTYVGKYGHSWEKLMISVNCANWEARTAC